MNDEKDLTIQAGLREVDNLILENQQLKASLNALEEKLRPFATYLSQNNQTANLNSLLAIQDNAGWTIEQLREKVAELQRLTTAYQANKILLESQLKQFTDRVALWEQKEAQRTEFYQKWRKSAKAFRSSQPRKKTSKRNDLGE